MKSVMAAINAERKRRETKQAATAAMESATRHAAEVPMETALSAVELFEKLVQLEAMAAPSMLSDLRVGRLNAAAATRGA